MLAATVRVTRDIDTAEDAAQEAYAEALRTWPRDGVPDRPGAWLTTVARRVALNIIRREQTLQRKLPLLIDPQPEDATMATPDPIPDDRLRLVFTCCHPALNAEAQVALTLRLTCGVTTPDIAHAFLVSESTMAARITRAKKKITAAHIRYAVPPPAERPARVDAVLTVVHLLYTTGHTAPSGTDLVRDDLARRALDLARMLHHLLPDQPEVGGLLALLLFHHARRSTRTGADGRLVRLEDQDRSSWDAELIAEGDRLVVTALGAAPPGRFTLQAAIAGVHAHARTYADTDWAQIVTLYDRLLTIWPAPVAALNRIVAVSMVDGPGVGLAELDRLDHAGRLDRYHYLPAFRAELLHRLGRDTEAAAAYQDALRLVDNDAERDFLAAQLARSRKGAARHGARE